MFTELPAWILQQCFRPCRPGHWTDGSKTDEAREVQSRGWMQWCIEHWQNAGSTVLAGMQEQWERATNSWNVTNFLTNPATLTSPSSQEGYVSDNSSSSSLQTSKKKTTGLFTKDAHWKHVDWNPFTSSPCVSFAHCEGRLSGKDCDQSFEKLLTNVREPVSALGYSVLVKNELVHEAIPTSVSFSHLQLDWKGQRNKDSSKKPELPYDNLSLSWQKKY